MKGRYAWMLGAIAVISVALVTVPIGAAANAADGAKIFAAKCKACHGVHGKGDGPVGGKLKPPAADLTNASTARMKTAADIIKLLTKGGKAVGLAPIHRPYAKFSREEVSALAEFVIGLRK